MRYQNESESESDNKNELESELYITAYYRLFLKILSLSNIII